MPNFLGQTQTAPIAESWNAQKGLAFRLLGYEIYDEEVRRFHLSDAPIRIVTAPARTSKSMSAAAEVFAWTCIPTNPPCSSLTWLIGPSYEVNKEFQYLWEWIVDGRAKFAPFLAKGWRITRAQNSPAQGNMTLILELGQDASGHTARAVIEGKSSTVERTLQGEEVSLAVLSEAAEHPQRIYEKYVSTRTWKTILPTTPKPYAKWIREMSVAGRRDPALGIESFKYHRGANPLYDKGRFERAERLAAQRSATGLARDWPEFAEQFLGDWVFYTGQVVPLDEALHVYEPGLVPLEECKIYASCDYGFEDACVALFWAQDHLGTLYLWDEIYDRRLVTEEYVSQIQQKLEPYRKQLGYVTGDPQEPQVEQYLRRMGLPVIQVNKKAQRDRAVGHRRICDLMAPREDGTPGMMISRDCGKTLAEWQELHYRELSDAVHRNEYATNAIMGADHAYDCFRYLAMTLPEPAPLVQPQDDLLSRIKARKREMQLASGQRNWKLARWAQSGVSPYAA